MKEQVQIDCHTLWNGFTILPYKQMAFNPVQCAIIQNGVKGEVNVLHPFAPSFCLLISDPVQVQVRESSTCFVHKDSGVFTA